jgi:putative phosphoesterase
MENSRLGAAWRTCSVRDARPSEWLSSDAGRAALVRMMRRSGCAGALTLGVDAYGFLSCILPSEMARIRLALVSDLHGNALALEQVLLRIVSQGADQIICLGDVATLGPEPERVLEMLHDSKALCVLGNHDEFMLRPAAVADYTSIPVLIDAIDWCRDRLSRASFDFLRSFAEGFELPLNDHESLSAFHGTPASNSTDLLATTDAETVEAWIGGSRGTVLAGGHTHLQMLRQHRGRLLVNPGSVGMPFKEYVAGAQPVVLPFAEYALIDADAVSVSVNLQRLALDKTQLRASVLAVDYPLGAFLANAYS